MPEPLNPETTDRIRSLCRQISDEHELDDPSRRKLHTQMEEKFLGFLSGAEKLSEESAFLLVQEHFGKPESVRSLLQEVQAMETHLSLARRIGAVLAASLGVSFLASLFGLTIVAISVHLLSGEMGVPPIGSSLIFTGCTLSSILLFWGILLYWRKRLVLGKALWFHRLRWIPFLGILVLLFFLDTAAPFLNYNNLLHAVRIPAPVAATPGMSGANAAQVVEVTETFKVYPPDFWIILRMPENRYLALNHLFLLFSSCLAWLWWCDIPPRRLRFLLISAASWFTYDYFLQNLQPKHTLTFDPISRHFTSSIQPPVHPPQILPPELLLYAVLSLSMLGVYSIVRGRIDPRKSAGTDIGY